MGTIPTRTSFGPRESEMASHLLNSWLALDEAIGPYRPALADLLGCTVDTLDLQCSPPPAFTPQGARNRGRRNLLDELYAISRHCPNGLAALRFLADALGYRLIPKVATAHDGRLLTEPSTLAAAVDALLTELNRRRPTMPDEAVQKLADAIADDLSALVADRLDRRRKAQK